MKGRLLSAGVTACVVTALAVGILAAADRPSEAAGRRTDFAETESWLEHLENDQPARFILQQPDETEFEKTRAEPLGRLSEVEMEQPREQLLARIATAENNLAACHPMDNDDLADVRVRDSVMRSGHAVELLEASKAALQALDASHYFVLPEIVRLQVPRVSFVHLPCLVGDQQACLHIALRHQDHPQLPMAIEFRRAQERRALRAVCDAFNAQPLEKRSELFARREAIRAAVRQVTPAERRFLLETFPPKATLDTGRLMLRVAGE